MIEMAREHRQAAVGREGPVGRWPVPIQFDAVMVRVVELEGLAHAVVAGAVDREWCPKRKHPIHAINEQIATVPIRAQSMLGDRYTAAESGLSMGMENSIAGILHECSLQAATATVAIATTMACATGGSVRGSS